jgi:hypothetical protein
MYTQQLPCWICCKVVPKHAAQSLQAVSAHVPSLTCAAAHVLPTSARRLAAGGPRPAGPTVRRQAAPASSECRQCDAATS